MRILSGFPGLPITSCATYHHLKCFTLLLLHGAAPDLTRFKHLQIPDSIATQFSVLHAIIKYKCPPEFLYLYREFGGNLWVRDSKGQLASEISEDAPALNLLKQFQGTPPSLQSQCRLVLRRGVLRQHQTTGVNQKILEILEFRSVDPQHFDPDDENQVEMYRTLTTVLNEVVQDMKFNFEQQPLAMEWQGVLQKKISNYLARCNDFQEQDLPKSKAMETRHPQQVAGPPPPPPPRQPTPPRPKLLRFPGAEGLKKKHFSGYKNSQ